MNTKLLLPEVQDFIFKTSNESVDLTKLILAGSPFEGITIQELAQQIAGRQKALQKLNSWASCRDIIYPPTLNLEQTSSDTTATYKSALVSGDSLIDLTGGWGVDAFAFSQQIHQVLHCELNPTLSELATHNFEIRKANNIETKCGDGLAVLKTSEKLDWIYVDPSRRSDTKGKVFFLQDCLPDVTVHQELFFEKADNILIKTSPLLDLQHGIETLKHVVKIHVVAVNNEVKELLWVLKKDHTGSVKITTANIHKQGTDIFTFKYGSRTLQQVSYGLPSDYLYEPNAAILKSGGFANVGETYELDKLHSNSHLYTSHTRVTFPGRLFKIIEVIPFSKKEVKRLGITKANITIRNFPDTVATLRKRLKIKDGGEDYLFFTTDLNERKIVIHAKKNSDAI
ncbi:THUMP-like domain-containing protein [Aquimarina sp. 2-A2]|uniref:THUMP-like domain-containing protein n=1 Tax=Aquimarina sp. 2-A2 TaxID=3382644 RepID=UPI00387EF4BE